MTKSAIVGPQKLWYETGWLPDAEPEMPPNIEDDFADTTGDATAADSCAPPAETTEPQNGKGTSTGWIVAGLSILGGLALFVLTGGRRVL